MDIKLERIFCQIGMIVDEGAYSDLSHSPDPKVKEFGLVLAWPPELAFFTMEAYPTESKDSPRPILSQGFRKGAEAVKTVEQCWLQDAPDLLKDLSDSVLLAGKLRDGQPIFLRVTIDTNHESFLEFVKPVPKSSAAMKSSPVIKIRVAVLDRERTLSITLSPLTMAPNFSGYVAIDLGNTGSTLAALDSNTLARDRATDIEFVPDKAQELISSQKLVKSGSVESVIRIREALNVTNERALKKINEERAQSGLELKKILGPEECGEFQTKQYCNPSAFKWEIGQAAWGKNAKNDGLIVGPKRRVTQPPGMKLPVTTVDLERLKEKKVTQTFTAQVDYWIPAELYVSRLIQNFQSIKRSRPDKLAITYPTSYSKRELEQLRSAIVRALKRARWERQRPEDLREANIDQALTLAIDEASAAAYFFLFRHAFSLPGGLSRFRYLYPHGLNLLLYDCGGGTTDISLVQARANEIDDLRIKVLGRAGMREFGGDEITTNIFKLLKAKLAWALNRAVGIAHHCEPDWKAAPPKGAGEANKWVEYLRKYDGQINNLVPTRFQPGSNNLIDQRRQDAALEIWRWAETVKYSLAGGAASVSKTAPEDVLPGQLALRSDEHASTIRDMLNAVTVERVEVDALIDAQVKQSVDLCNNLIRAKLTGESEMDNNQVDLVCLAGNGTQYPLLREQLLENLEVPFLKEEHKTRFVYERDDLKQVVAKGAVLALADPGAVGVTFVSRLSEQLPFYVGYSDGRFNAPDLLYEEGMLYSDLKPIKKDQPQVAVSAEGQSPVSRFDVQLQRRWPGEKKTVWWPFLTFRFKNKIEGPVTVSYDETRHDFVVEHDGEFGQLLQSDNDDKYYAPVQRGKL